MSPDISCNFVSTLHYNYVQFSVPPMRNSSPSDPRFLKAFRNLEEAISLQRQGRLDEAEKAFARVVKKNPAYFDALHLYGLFKYQRGQFDDAHKFVARAIKINPRSANAFSSLGVILAHQGRHKEALESFDTVLRFQPDHLQALTNRCNSLNELGLYDDCISSTARILEIDPNYSDAYIIRGAALLRRYRYMEALESYDRSLKLNPNLAIAWVGRGNVLYELNRYGEAIIAYDKAIALKPDLALKPDSDQAWIRLHAKMHLCNWANFNSDTQRLIMSTRNGVAAASPFAFLSIPSSAADQFRCAGLWAARKHPPAKPSVWRGERYHHDRIRIAYISSEFRPHPVSYLMAGLIEGHTKERFSVTGISLQSEDTSETGQRMKRAFETFIDGSNMVDQKIAQLIREQEIDIAVDLNGFTYGSRTDIFAARPAPIQINYLGYPGTMGASYIDYIIADQIVVPNHQQEFYSEKIVYMPNSFQANDRYRSISEKKFTRAELGLPPDGIVFCCFNSSYKISPDVFEIWIRILNQVSDSVLWLVANDKAVEDNLRREAAARNVKGERLIFAPRLPYPEHLARLSSADLFLDTAPFNAGTTASDALWAGLPVLTRIGDGFAGRMAASLLAAIDLPELITSSPQAYEALAIELATNPAKLRAIKLRLSENRLTRPLFNTQLFTSHIEAAYTAMYERYQTGLPPDHIYLPQ